MTVSPMARHCMQAPGATPQDASCYQETLSRVRRLIPFVQVHQGGSDWSFLGERPHSMDCCPTRWP